MREMILSDVAVVCAIENLVQPHPWTQGNFSDALRSGYRCLVDEIDSEIVSYAVLMPLLDEAELLTIAVAPSQQRNGLGGLMLRAVIDVAREKNMRKIFLEVRVSNAAAIALYRANGFVEIGLRRGYYQHTNGREDALLMACELRGDEADG
jgi:[ribosomal protein S18]-alanine N-acetyltransferase